MLQSSLKIQNLLAFLLQDMGFNDVNSVVVSVLKQIFQLM